MKCFAYKFKKIVFVVIVIYISALAQEAEGNMEAVQPPLFLRFINLLMNDAVFLLDEALSNMAQLRQMLQARYVQEYTGCIIFKGVLSICMLICIRYYIQVVHS